MFIQKLDIIMTDTICRSAHHSQWDLQNDVVIGLNKQYLTTPEEVTEHVEDLIFIIIGE